MKKKLSTLVGVYEKKFAPGLAAYLDYFKNLGTLDEAIECAARAKAFDGKIHPHQRRVGAEILGKACKKILRHADQLEACKSFDQLFSLVEQFTKGIDRFGSLAVYDTSLRIGAFLDRWPEVVYLHAGTKQGCKALDVDTSRGIVEIDELPEPIRALEPYQAEDFLCIFKDEFGGVGRTKGCLPTGC